jgi:fatty-acyl-CoA synthase
MKGYFGRKRSEAFTDDDWLHTGDRGYLVDGELYVTGRYKHIIKRAGRTLDCAFVENSLKSVPGVRGGMVAVFGLPDVAQGLERIVVMAETEYTTPAERNALSSAILGALRAELLPMPDAIELVGPGKIPRTSSGKIRHGEARDAYIVSRADSAAKV